MKMIYKNEKIHWLTAIMTLAARDPKVRMILFAGYIDDGMTYELYSDGLPYDITNAIYDAVKENDEWHEAVKKAGILEKGVQKIAKVSFDSWDMWDFLLNATDTIISDSEMSEMIPLHDRIIAHGLYDLWKRNEIDENNWEYHYDRLREQVWGE